MSNKDWQVGPELKQKPGSQGTLFRGGTKYSSPERFPRGYTPERQADVRDAVKTSDWQSKTDSLHATNQRREIADTIARSTAPVEHLNGLQWAHVEPNQELTQDGKSAGLYFKSRNQPMVGVKPDYTRTSTVLHELGHHVSHSGSDNGHVANYSYSSAEGGKEEAIADNYAQTHFRDRRGQQVERPTYGGGQYAGHIDRSPEFWKSYHQTRDNSMYSERVKTENAEWYKHYPEDEIHPDNTAQDPLIETNRVSKDFGDQTHEINLNDEALPGETRRYPWQSHTT